MFLGSEKVISLLELHAFWTILGGVDHLEFVWGHVSGSRKVHLEKNASTFLEQLEIRVG